MSALAVILGSNNIIIEFIHEYNARLELDLTSNFQTQYPKAPRINTILTLNILLFSSDLPFFTSEIIYSNKVTIYGDT